MSTDAFRQHAGDVRRGQKWVGEFAPSAAADDITGQTIKFHLAAGPGSTVLLTKQTGGSGVAVTDVPNRKFQVTLLAADTKVLPAGNYSWEVWFEGDPDPICAGTVRILEPVRTPP